MARGHFNPSDYGPPEESEGMYCPHCGAENYPPGTENAAGIVVCEQCGKALERDLSVACAQGQHDACEDLLGSMLWLCECVCHQTGDRI